MITTPLTMAPEIKETSNNLEMRVNTYVQVLSVVNTSVIDNGRGGRADVQ